MENIKKFNKKFEEEKDIEKKSINYFYKIHLMNK